RRAGMPVLRPHHDRDRQDRARQRPAIRAPGVPELRQPRTRHHTTQEPHPHQARTMTTLYRPVLIESAAQAEALPEGSIVINDDGDRYSRHPRWGEWHSVADDRDLTEDLDSTFMPPTITALAPIEAEEEWTAMGSDN